MMMKTDRITKDEEFEFIIKAIKIEKSLHFSTFA
jgi:hypothetical protein